MVEENVEGLEERGQNEKEELVGDVKYIINFKYNIFPKLISTIT